jgi:ABC-type uncharacterized transport system involved in gliding motility auxiliary subunit
MTRKFYCRACGRQVSYEAESCPYCGRFFTAVKCPKCGFSGEDVLFIEGCPKCVFGWDKSTENFMVKSKKRIYKSISLKWVRRLILPSLVLLLLLLYLLWRQI